MAEGDGDPPSAVRIELLGGDRLSADEIAMPGPGSSGPSRLPAAAMLVALLGVFGGLWWLSNLEGAEEDAAPEEPEVVEEVVGDAEGVPDWLADANALRAGQTVELDVVPTYAVQANSAVMVGGAWVDGASAESSGPSGVILGGRLFWRGFPAPPSIEDHRLVGLYDNGDRFIAFSSTADESGAATELVLHTSDSGQADEIWTELTRFPVDGHVRTVSSRDGRWAAIVDRRAQSSSASPPMQTQILTGLVDGAPDETTLIEVAPDEFVSSFAASSDGFYAIVVRLELGSISASRPPTPQLRRWTPATGWEVLEEDFSPPGGVSARIIDAGPTGIFISWRTDLFRVDPDLPVTEWPPVASGNAVTGVLDQTYTPEVTPARIGDGFLIVDRTVGEVGTLWVSLSGALWQRFEIENRLEHVSLLTIDETGTAVLTAEQEGQPVVFQLGLTRPANDASTSAADIASNTPAFEPEVQQRDIVDGEWSTPVFSAATVDGAGFVGLSNVNGQISLVESSNGFGVDQTTATNFPFGYFTNEMRTTNAGYHVVGQLGLFEDAVFTSVDGLRWDRFEIEQIGTSTALQIDHFHRSENTAAMAASLGWADDLARTERAVVWWDSSGTRWIVPPSPCEQSIRCSITSLLAVSDGIVVTHQEGDEIVLSKWTEPRGWRTNTDPDADLLRYPVYANAHLQSVATDRIQVLGLPALIESRNGGLTWDYEFDGPPGVRGAFVAITDDRGTAVFLSDDENDAWVLHDDNWTRYDLTSVELGAPLAISDGVALFGGGAGSGSVVIRFAPAGGS